MLAQFQPKGPIMPLITPAFLLRVALANYFLQSRFTISETPENLASLGEMAFLQVSEIQQKKFPIQDARSQETAGLPESEITPKLHAPSIANLFALPHIAFLRLKDAYDKKDNLDLQDWKDLLVHIRSHHDTALITAFDNLLEQFTPKYFHDPISYKLMCRPVTVPIGCVFDHETAAQLPTDHRGYKKILSPDKFLNQRKLIPVITCTAIFWSF